MALKKALTLFDKQGKTLAWKVQIRGCDQPENDFSMSFVPYALKQQLEVAHEQSGSEQA